MKAETYAGKVARRVKCSGKKRREIKRQFLSDIAARQEAGEPLEEIFRDMGTPAEAAGELNGDLPKRERSAHTRNLVVKILCVILAVLVILAGFVYWLLPKGYEIGHSDSFTREVVEDRAMTVIALLDAEDYEALQAISIEEMLEFVNPETLGAAKEMVGSDWGAFMGYGNRYMQELRQMGHDYAIIQITANYENVNVTYTITLDEELRLAGIYMR